MGDGSPNETVPLARYNRRTGSSGSLQGTQKSDHRFRGALGDSGSRRGRDVIREETGYGNSAP